MRENANKTMPEERTGLTCLLKRIFVLGNKPSVILLVLRRWGQILCVALVSIVFLTGGCPGESWHCPYIEVTNRGTQTESYQWKFWNNDSSMLHSISDAMADCTAGVRGYGSCDYRTKETWLAELVWVWCPNFSVAFFLPDPRDWTEGEKTIKTPVLFWSSGETCGSKYGLHCFAEQDSVTLKVVSARGERQPWPEIVSNDFERDYEVVFAAADPANAVCYFGYVEAGAECSCSYQGSLQLGFTLQAENIKAVPEFMCNSYMTDDPGLNQARNFNEGDLESLYYDWLKLVNVYPDPHY